MWPASMARLIEALKEASLATCVASLEPVYRSELFSDLICTPWHAPPHPTHSCINNKK